jgi:6-phosphogluconolactonase
LIDLSQLGAGISPHIYPESQQVATAAAAQILKAAAAAISERGAFHLVLAGGTTPKQAYQLLVAADTDWACWHIYYGDERCLSPDDPERNSMMARRAWLDHVPIPARQHHPIPAELGAEVGAAAYSIVIKQAMPFDLVLLGMGEDGHTASLFPGHLHPEGEAVHAVHHAPKPPADRVTLSRTSLSNSRQLLLLVTGATKQQPLASWAAGEPLPLATVVANCRADLLLDKEAAGIVE